MPIIAFNFTRINAERHEQKPGPMNIKNNVVLKDAIKTKLALGPQSQDVLRITFEFMSSYEPHRGHITLEGELIYLEKPDKIDSLAKAWAKDKKLPKDEARIAVNHILGKCNVEAIIISREINLPAPIQLPSIAK